MAFNSLHLNHLQQVRCCCWCKVKNSESKSQLGTKCYPIIVGCCCWCKVKNSESKSQRCSPTSIRPRCCCCWCKVKNSESKSQRLRRLFVFGRGCCCWCKVKNSESKSQRQQFKKSSTRVVVAGVKLKILKANHNISLFVMGLILLLLLV